MGQRRAESSRQSGKLNNESLATILLRKTDWHDYEGIQWLLEQGVDPNLMTHWGKTALHNAALSDNALKSSKCCWTTVAIRH
jgi:ankyrin repeat protein